MRMYIVNEEVQLKIIQIVLENAMKTTRLVNIGSSVAQVMNYPYPCCFYLSLLLADFIDYENEVFSVAVVI